MTTEAKSDWTKWNGGECPVAPDDKVDIRIRNYRRQEDLIDVRAGDWVWEHGNLAWITEFRTRN